VGYRWEHREREQVGKPTACGKSVIVFNYSYSYPSLTKAVVGEGLDVLLQGEGREPILHGIGGGIVRCFPLGSHFFFSLSTQTQHTKC
jgi:hypothetical protein